MEISVILGGIGATVSVLTLIAVGWRERREGSARAEQRAKAIIDLLRISENPAEPEAVREFARGELRRMRAELQADDDHEGLMAKVFGSPTVNTANDQLANSEVAEPKPLDPDIERLISIVKWWNVSSGMTPQQEWQVRLSMIIALMGLGFMALAIGAVDRSLFS